MNKNIEILNEALRELEIFILSTPIPMAFAVFGIANVINQYFPFISYPASILEATGIFTALLITAKVIQIKLLKKPKEPYSKKYLSTCYKDGKPCECSGLCRENY